MLYGQILNLKCSIIFNDKTIVDNHATAKRAPFFKQHWVPPILLAILLLPVLIFLPWQTQKIEFKEHQQQLIADSLWVEQSIRFQFVRNEENLRFLADTIITKSIAPEQLKERFSALIENRPELQQLIWLDAKDQLLYSTSPFNFDEYWQTAKIPVSHVRASKFPQYSEPAEQLEASPNVLMDYYLPLFRHNHYLGCLIVRYNMPDILEKMVPWWFARDNEISVSDMNDAVFARRTDNGYGRNIYTHSINLDLSGVNLILKTNSIKMAPRLLSNYLVVAVLFLGLGLLWSLWALWRDILRRNAAESAVREQMAFRRAMEKSLVTGMRVLSLEGKLVYVNPAFCDMVGYSEEQLIGQTQPLPFWDTDTEESNQHQLSLQSKQEFFSGFETVYRHANGNRIPVLIYESALLDEDGSQTGWMGSILDISYRKNAEKVLREHEARLETSARLSTMGELASVMAHELNQPLAAISSYATGALNMMKSGTLEQSMLMPALEQMQSQAQRAGQIIHSVYDFVAKREPKRNPTQLITVFNNVLPLIKMQAKSFLIEVQFHIDNPLPDVLIDTISIEQVILNLTRNALQAMNDILNTKRLLLIEVRRVANGVRVEVIDNGAGIKPEIESRLFSPFFSTKSEGMGMGLNICRTILEFHGSKLTFRANPTGGTIFSFLFSEIEKTPL